MRGETIEEIAGAAEAMRGLATRVQVSQDYLVDIVGTGGDGANLFNVSTAASFVAAASGARVAKHGNRSVSSSSGSSDVLEAFGVPMTLTPEQVRQCIEQVGLGFMFAPAHHSAMRHAIGPRRELGLRTLFNVLGPLTNPAFVERQVLGVFDKTLCQPLAEALGKLGSKHALVLHSDDGLDEISVAAQSRVWELRNGAIERFHINPEDYGHAHADLSGLVVESAAASAELIRAAFSDSLTETASKARSMIALNAGAAVYTAGLAETLSVGVQIAAETMLSGAALDKLDAYVTMTRGLASQSS